MNPQDKLKQPKFWSRPEITSPDGEPLPWLSRQSSFRANSGIGAIILASFASAVGILPLLLMQQSFPKAAAVIFATIGLPVAAFFYYQGIRRMHWEHTHGGILKRGRANLLTLGVAIALVIFILFIAK